MKRRSFLTLCLGLPSSLQAAPNYPQVQRGHALHFPRDHGAHPNFRTEWWYITGWVHDEAERPRGIQVTFFRNRPGVQESNPSAFAPRQLLFAHAALADPRRGALLHAQRAARQGFGLAQANEGNTDVQIDAWSLRLQDNTYVARIRAQDFAYDLEFRVRQPILLQGERGWSQKGPSPVEASYYYSQPQLAVAGSLRVDGASHSVSGVAWFDHEWASEMMSDAAVGWDWTGINLADGGALMVIRMRDAQGKPYWGSAVLRGADGTVHAFAPDALALIPLRKWRSPRTGIEYPVSMRVRAGEVELDLEPLMDDQELDARASTGTIYWEGAVRALRDGRPAGVGYLELTGYGEPLAL